MARIRVVVLALMAGCALAAFGTAASADGFGDAKAGAAALNRGDSDGAIRLLTRALNSGQLPDKNRAVTFVNRGNAWVDKGDSGKAIADYSAAIRLNPRYEEALFNRGTTWLGKGDHDKAIADFNRAIRLNPKDEMAFGNRGVAWHDKGQDDKAIADYNEAIRLNPHNAVAFNDLGVIGVDRGQYDKAIADYNEALRLDPKYAVALNNRGIAWKKKGEFDKAIADFNKAIRLRPRLAPAFANRGQLRFIMGRFAQAESDLAQARHLGYRGAFVPVWLYLSRSRQGDANAAAALAADTKPRDAGKWPAPVIAMFTGRIDPQTVAARAAAATPAVRKRHLCEADFYAGEWYLLKGQKDRARGLLRKARNSCDVASDPYSAATAELKRL